MRIETVGDTNAGQSIHTPGNEHGLFQPGTVTVGGEFASTVVDGLRIRVEWLWSRTPVAKVLLELGLGR